MAVRKKLGDALVDAGVLDPAKLKAALQHQRTRGGRLGRILIDHGLIDEKRLTRTLSEQLAVPVVELDAHTIHDVVRDEIPREMADKFNLFPVGIKRTDQGSTLYVAMSDPTNFEAIDAIQFRSGKSVSTMIAGEQEIERAIRRTYYGEAVRSTTPPPMSAVRFSGHDFDLEPAGAADEIPVVTGTVLDRPSPGATGPDMFGPVGGFLGADDDTQDVLSGQAPVLEPYYEPPLASDQTQPYAINLYLTPAAPPCARQRITPLRVPRRSILLRRHRQQAPAAARRLLSCEVRSKNPRPPRRRWRRRRRHLRSRSSK